MRDWRLARIFALPTVSLVGLTVITAISAKRVFVDWSFLPLLLTVALATHGVLAACRALKVPLLAATPLSLLAAVGAIGHAMYRTTVRLGFFPTRSTWDLAWTDLRDAWRQFDEAVAPVPSSHGFLLATALAIGLIAYTADTFAFRAFGRVEAVIPSGVVFTFVAALGVKGHDGQRLLSAAGWLFAACLSVALLRSAHGDLGSTWLGGHRRERTIRIAAAAGALSLLTVGTAYAVAPRLPGAGEDALIDPGGDNQSDVTVVSPIVDIRARLVNRSNRVLFRVASDEPAYWHLTSLPIFDGTQWKTNEKFSKASGTLKTEVLAEGDELAQTFTIDQMGEGWVPAAHQAVGVDTSDDLVFNASTSTLRVAGDGSLYNGMTYTVDSVLPRFSADELRAASSTDPPDSVYLELPGDFPQRLRRIAQGIAGDQPTTFDKAITLQNYFRQNFDYSTDVPRGNGDDAIETFLNQKVGYCEQFAGTFAALGRALGIPTRVAVGFTPGVRENGRYVVRGRNAHAWPEVWFDGLGWVLFEPTPNRGAPGAEQYTGLAPQQDEVVAPDTGGGGGTTGNPSDQPPASTVTRTTAPLDRGEPGTAPTGTAAPTPTAPTAQQSFHLPAWAFIPFGLLGLALVWLLVAPYVVSALRRRRRGRSPADRVSAAWQDTTVALGILGAGHHPDETHLEHADRAWKLTGINRVSLRSIGLAATKAVYAAETVDLETALECERLRHEVAGRVKARASWSTRLLARMNPRTGPALR